MATTTRQQGRRATGSGAAADSNQKNTTVASPVASSRPAAAVPARRYVLDVPKTHRQRTRRTEVTTNDGSIDGYTLTNSAYRLNESGDGGYYIRDGVGDSTGLPADTYDDNYTIKKLIESGISYQNVVNEDREIQALTSQTQYDIKQYPINSDPNPELVVRPNTQRITYRQDIAVKYLKPSTPPPPGPIIIREIRAPAPPPAPPMVLQQRPPPPRTPSPVLIREKPPQRPKSVPTTVIKKMIPPPPPPPRKLIIERYPVLPAKPRPFIIERWLPYKKQKRQIILEKAKPLEPMPRVRNTIIEWRPPEVEIVRRLNKIGVQQADPQRYFGQHGEKLYTTEVVQKKLSELGLQEELNLIQEQQSQAAKEQLTSEQEDEYNVRKILSGYDRISSNRQNYSVTTTETADPVVRIVRSSSQSGITDEYGEQQIFYDQSPNDYSTGVTYQRSNYNINESPSGLPFLTEEMLFKTSENNGERYSTRLLTKLGSQLYYIPPDQLDLSAYGTRINPSERRYYTMSPGEIGDESQSEDVRGTQMFDGETFLQVRTSDMKDLGAALQYDTGSDQQFETE